MILSDERKTTIDNFLQDGIMKPLDKLLELDEKHDDILRQLDELDLKISRTLKDWSNIKEDQQERLTTGNLH